VALQFCSSTWYLSKNFACGAHNSDFKIKLISSQNFRLRHWFSNQNFSHRGTATNFHEIYIDDGPFLYWKDQENQEIERLYDQENQEIGEKMTRKPGKILKI